MQKEMKQLNIIKSFLLIIISVFLVKCIHLSIYFSYISNESVYLESNYWLPKYISSKYRSSDIQLSSKILLGYKPTPSKQFKEKSSCRSMFEIKKSAEQNWDTDEPYEALSGSLPSLLIWPQEGKKNSFTSKSDRNLQHSTEYYKNYKENSDAVNKPIPLNETRLQILNGSVPYLPCKIKNFTADDVGTCISARADAGSSTWIAFVGASKMRQKLHEFFNLLPKSFTYLCYVAEKQVSCDKLLNSIEHKVHADYDVIGYMNNTSNKNETHKIQITVLWNPFGTGVDNLGIEPPSTRLFKWATDTIIPDVVVIGYGTWYLIMPAIEHNDGNKHQLEPYDLLDFNIRKLKKTFLQINKKTKVILWAQTRFRQYTLLSEPRPPGDVKEYQVHEWFKSRLWLHTLTYSIGYMDSWLSKIILKDSSIWHWDSTLPFHYANMAECSSWRPSATVNFPNGSIQADPRYKGTWWHCQDTHHSSYQNNHDEAIMLLNMLCNPYLESMPDDLCC